MYLRSIVNQVHGFRYQGVYRQGGHEQLVTFESRPWAVRFFKYEREKGYSPANPLVFVTRITE